MKTNHWSTFHRTAQDAMQNFLRRPKFAAGLRNRPGFTALAVLMLSLGVGATTALFTVTGGSRAQSEAGLRFETVLELEGSESAYAMVALPRGAERPLRAILGVLAIAFLLACARGASAMIATPRASLVVIETTIGALAVATLALRALALPAIGLRAAAFALSISLVSVFFARAARRKGAPLTL